MSGFLLFLFGCVAYAFPLMLGYSAWLPFQYSKYSPGLFVLRFLGFFLILIVGCGLCSLIFVTGYLPAGSGGILGYFVNDYMAGLFNQAGAALIMIALFLAGITLFTGCSWSFVAKLLYRLLSVLAGFKCLGKIFKRKGKALKVRKEKKTKDSIFEAGLVEDAIFLDKSQKEELKKKEPVLFNSAKVQDGSELLNLDTTLAKNPSLDLLDVPELHKEDAYTKEERDAISSELELHLKNFGIHAEVVAVHPGPVITRFELMLAAGTKASKITNISKDLARSLSVMSVRVVEVIPGKAVVGLELPNKVREIVRLREILSSKQYKNATSPLVLALGKDISGNPVIVDLAKMPHLLVAGTTGSGKSVGINAIILSLLYKYSDKDVGLILIDPKMLELSVYSGIPHLLTPVVTDVKDAAKVLRWCVSQMEKRYKMMANLGVRNIIGYNSKIKEAKRKGAPLLDLFNQSEELETIPYIVVVIDEFADMVMVIGKKIEELIARIAQKARAAGIHLVLATQRPSVDVITGLIKANIPSRIAFQVSSKIDSRTVIEQMGAEQLLGNGDMLYLPPGTVIPVRVHGAFVADDEVHRVVDFLKKQGAPRYIKEILEDADENISGMDLEIDSDGETDPIYDQAVEFILDTKKVSISSIQRRFKIGYNRAARIVETMESAGIVSPMGSNGNREILVPSRK